VGQILFQIETKFYGDTKVQSVEKIRTTPERGYTLQTLKCV